jgi:hypothetical protein
MTSSAITCMHARQAAAGHAGAGAQPWQIRRLSSPHIKLYPLRMLCAARLAAPKALHDLAGQRTVHAKCSCVPLWEAADACSTWQAVCEQCCGPCR